MNAEDEIDASACELYMCMKLIELAKEFYRNPENLKAFEDWRKAKNAQ